MKVLSLLEPWASLMALGAKSNETRSWQTTYRGDLAIAASNRKVRPILKECDYTMIRAAFEALRDGYKLIPDSAEDVWDYLDENTIGRILCVVNLNSVVPTAHLEAGYYRIGPLEELFGNYRSGRFAWRTDTCVRLPNPIRFKGSQGIRDLDPGIVGAIRRQLA